ncbi:hypothetical protein FRC11_001865 [Ceratobasidium sp. 423]|nr:hypothetical protein FRC11_001865 [Ceratobasidium sp. 423]
MKALSGADGRSPMAPPPPCFNFREDIGSELNVVPAAEPPIRQHPLHTARMPQIEPDPPPISENTHPGTRPNATTNEQLYPSKPSDLHTEGIYHLVQLSAAMRETMDLPEVEGQSIGYGMALDGISLERLMLGAAITAVPGVQTASAVYTTVTSGAERLSRTVHRATHLSRSLRGVRVGCTDENISGGWVEVSSQDIRGTE